MRSKKPRRAMDREDTWAQAAEIAPRLFWRIAYNISLINKTPFTTICVCPGRCLGSAG